MLTPQLLNTLGLGLGMIGVFIIFIYGPPQPDLEPGVSLGLEDGTPMADGRTVAQYNADVLKLRARHSLMSKVGLICVFFGFALQLWATWW
jgi:hypothetical protein